MSVLTDFNNFNKKQDFKIKKKYNENLDNLFLRIKIEKIKNFKSFIIKDFSINNVFNVYKKEIVFYIVSNHFL